ncbi:MAG: AMP-binding protein [bacterium]
MNMRPKDPKGEPAFPAHRSPPQQAAQGTTQPNLLTRLLDSAKRSPDRIAVLQTSLQKEQPILCGRFLQDVERLASGLQRLGVKKGDRVALLSENRYEWALADFAAMAAGALTVPLHATLSPRLLAHELKHSRTTLLFASEGPRLKELPHIRSQVPGLRRIVFFEGPLPAGFREPDLSLRDVMALGGKKQVPLESLAGRIASIDPATIVYTSGTSGSLPKGVLLTHRNFLAELDALEGLFRVQEGDVLLSFLPLAQILQRVADIKVLLEGGTVSYCPNMDDVPRMLLDTKPHLLVGVPRTYEKIRDLILTDMLKGPSPRKTLSKWIFWWMASAPSPEEKTRALPPLMEPFLRWVKRVGTQPIKDRMGGRIRNCFCAGAPLPRDLEAFFEAVQVPLYNMYGMTELTGPVTGNGPAGHRPGTVGVPLPGCQVRTRPDGEILIRGDSVSPGYYRPRLAPLPATEQDGWFPTGDLGRLDPDGFLVLTGRKKDILITAAGKNIVPQPLERTLRLNPYVQQAIVVGDGRKHLGALIVPSFDHLEAFAGRMRILWLNHQELLEHPKVQELYREVVGKINEERGQLEAIRTFALLPERFTLEADEITPTYRMRRAIIEKRYRREIESLYRKPPLKP